MDLSFFQAAVEMKAKTKPKYGSSPKRQIRDVLCACTALHACCQFHAGFNSAP
jgi:hypothetical protein